MSDTYSFLNLADYKKQSDFDAVVSSVFFAIVSSIMEVFSYITILATMGFKQDPDL